MVCAGLRRPSGALVVVYAQRKAGAVGMYALSGLGTTLDDLAAAITRMEGSCSAPGVCVNNNPGNLRAYLPTQPVDSRGIRIFPDYQSGYSALLAQEQINIGKGLTLDEFFGGKQGVYPGYAPAAADRNQPNVYAGNVASWLGIPRDVTLSSIFGGSNVSGSTGTQANVYDLGAGDGSSFLPSDLEDWLPATADDGLSPMAWGALGLAALGLAWAAS